MTDKELRRLSRSELLEMLIAQTEENRQLKIKLERAEAQLRDRRIAVEKAGSLAEAALQLNRVFDAVDKAAQQYLKTCVLMSEKGSRRVMKSKSWKSPEPPTLEQLEAELGRENTNGGINAFFAAPSIRLWLLRL